MFHNLHNYWGFWMGFDRRFGAWDDLATRGGPVLRTPASTFWGANLFADDRNPVSGWLSANVEWGLGGDNLSTYTGLELELKPASNIEIEINPSYRYASSDAQWVENVDVDGDDEDDRFIFGELKNRIFEYALGSTIFVVWQQNRDRDFEDTTDPDFDLADTGRTFRDEGDNIFLVKINRWMGL
jgi:hypothetical protein